MKRSEINKAINFAKKGLALYKFKLPTFGYWEVEDFLNQDGIEEIVELMLGWDVTDFGLGDFDSVGAVLFTLRNGNLDNTLGVPYAEKLIILKEGQRLPLHCHLQKTEDIINRFGGVLSITLFESENGVLDKQKEVEVSIDGMKRIYHPGEEILLEAGQSITIRPGQYHFFGAKVGYGDLICGEVSSINDDLVDNYFTEKINRFSKIEEDDKLRHLLCNEYKEVLKS